MSSQTPPQKVTLSIALSLSPSNTLSLSPTASKTTINLIATIRQLSSPHPSRPLTLLTTYSALDTTPTENAFVMGYLPSPTSINTDPVKTIKLYPHEVRVHWVKVNGALDLRERERMKFVTVPPVVGDGGKAVQVSWEMSTQSLLEFYSKPLEEKLAMYEPGERYRFRMAKKLKCAWWTWGALDEEEMEVEEDGFKDNDAEGGGEHSLKGKKFSRWMLPDGYVGDDDGKNANGEQVDWDGISRKLRDRITGHNVNALGSRSCVEDEERPNIPAMVREGWVFSQPTEGIEVVCENGDDGVVFEFVE